MWLKQILIVLAALAWAQGATAGQLVDLKVVDRAQGGRLPVHWHAGQGYLAGEPGHEYSVVVRNRSGAEVLAVVSVDGVNGVTGQTANPSQSGYVIAPYGKVVIRGWRKNLAQTAAFYFTDLSDSYAARTGRPSHVGVIGVAVFRKKHVRPPVPIAREAFPGSASDQAGAAKNAPAEPSAQADESGRREMESRSRPDFESRSRLGTGHGRREHSQARYVSFERATTHPAEVVQLRYDSRANLVARGVIHAPAPCAWPCPQPFPGFAPDPGPISRFTP